MQRRIKFPLVLKDEQQARTMEELQEHFDLEKIYEYFRNGKLAVWLEDRYYDDEAQQIKELDPQDSGLKNRLCHIFSIEYTEEDTIDLERVEERRRKRELLKQYTDDDAVLEKAGQAAFNQEELSDLLDEGVREIYLCDNRFAVPVKVRDCKYTGIYGAVIEVRSREDISFDDLGIVFENVEFSCQHNIVIQADQSKNIKGDGIAAKPLGTGFEVEVRHIKGYIRTDEITDKKTWFPEPVENSVPGDTIKRVLYSHSLADGKNYFLGMLPDLFFGEGEDHEDWRINYDRLYQVSGDYVYFVSSGYENNGTDARRTSVGSSAFSELREAEDDPYGFDTISVFNPTLSTVEDPKLSYGIFRSKYNGQDKKQICPLGKILDYFESGKGCGIRATRKMAMAFVAAEEVCVEKALNVPVFQGVREIIKVTENEVLFVVSKQESGTEALVIFNLQDNSLRCLDEKSYAERIISLDVNDDYVIYSLADEGGAAILKYDLKKKISETIIWKTRNGYNKSHKGIGIVKDRCVYFVGDAGTEKERGEDE